jgi:5-methyltetrahydrofolate--homocysteine methyltransferase
VLVPQLVYGFFAVNADGNELVVWQDGNRSIESMRFAFPRQRVEPYLCIADFFRPIDSGELDYAGSGPFPLRFERVHIDRIDADERARA